MQLSKGFQITLGVLLAVAICAGLYFGGKYAYDWYQVERAPTVTDTQNHLYTRTDSMTHGERCFNCGWLQKEDTSVFQSRDFKDDTGYDIVEFWCCPSCKKMNVTNDFLDKVEGDIESGLKRLETAEEDVSEDEETTTTADRYQHYKSVEIDQNCPYCGYRNVGKFKVYKDTDNFDEDTFKCIDCGRYYTQLKQFLIRNQMKFQPKILDRLRMETGMYTREMKLIPVIPENARINMALGMLKMDRLNFK